ncbi:MAG: hypothetical protein K2M46_06800 [Lachnospiraceae bacterium]|nr:hypothetical protein [Lachnospiraceae bacterium]
MRKKSRIFMVMVTVVCIVLFGVIIFTKINITDYDTETHTYEETEFGNKSNTISEDYAPTEN